MSQLVGKWMNTLFEGQKPKIESKYFEYKGDLTFKKMIETTLTETPWDRAQKWNSQLISHYLFMLKFKNNSTANSRMKQFWGMED